MVKKSDCDYLDRCYNWLMRHDFLFSLKKLFNLDNVTFVGVRTKQTCFLHLENERSGYHCSPAVLHHDAVLSHI